MFGKGEKVAMLLFLSNLLPTPPIREKGCGGNRSIRRRGNLFEAE